MQPGRCVPHRRLPRAPLVYRIPRTRDLLAPLGSLSEVRWASHGGLLSNISRDSQRNSTAFFTMPITMMSDYAHLPFAGFLGPKPTTWNPFPSSCLASGKLMLLPFFAPRFLLDAFTTRALRHTKTGSPPSSIFFCSRFHSSGAMILAGPSTVSYTHLTLPTKA